MTPPNGQIRAFSCTVAKRVIRLRRFSAECWSRQGQLYYPSISQIGEAAPSQIRLQHCNLLNSLNSYHFVGLLCTVQFSYENLSRFSRTICNVRTYIFQGTL